MIAVLIARVETIKTDRDRTQTNRSPRGILGGGGHNVGEKPGENVGIGKRGETCRPIG